MVAGSKVRKGKRGLAPSSVPVPFSIFLENFFVLLFFQKSVTLTRSSISEPSIERYSCLRRILMTMRFRNCIASLAALFSIWGMASISVGSQALTNAEQMSMCGGTGYFTCAIGAATCTGCVAATCAPNLAGTTCLSTGGSAGCVTAGGLDICIAGGAGCNPGSGGFACGGPQSPSVCTPTATVIRANGTLMITACGGGACAASNTPAAQAACPNKCN